MQGRPCCAGWRFGPGLRGGRDAMRAQHDVSGAPLPPRHHLQPEHLPGLLVLTHLLPPRSESRSVIQIWFCLVFCDLHRFACRDKLSPPPPPPPCFSSSRRRRAATRWCASVMSTSRGRTAASSTRCPAPPRQTARRNTKVRLEFTECDKMKLLQCVKASECCLFSSPADSFTPTGPSGTNIIIGSVAGAILVAAIVLGGTGWGFK